MYNENINFDFGDQNGEAEKREQSVKQKLKDMVNKGGDPTLKKFEKEAKKRQRKEKKKKMVNDGIKFFRENQDVIIMVTPVALFVIGKSFSILSKALSAYKLDREIHFKEHTIYDRSLGRYVTLKKKITTDQALEIESRKQAGEKLNTILKDMKLI